MTTSDDRPLYEIDHLVELGRLTVAAARIEYIMDGITAVLISPDATDVGALMVRGQFFARLARTANEILHSRLTADGPAGDLAEPIEAWIRDAVRVMKRRNALLHPMWMLPSPTEKVTVVSRGPGAPNNISLETLRRDVADADEVAGRAGELWEKLIFRYGHLDELIEATRAMDPEWWDAQED